MLFMIYVACSGFSVWTYSWWYSWFRLLVVGILYVGIFMQYSLCYSWFTLLVVGILLLDIFLVVFTLLVVGILCLDIFLLVFLLVFPVICSGYSVTGHIPGGIRHVLPANASLRRREVLPRACSSSCRLAVQPHPQTSRSLHEVHLLQRLPEL